MLIYKIAPASLWREAEACGVFAGAPIDQADGFIHFSTGPQAQETADKHFRAPGDLVLVAVEAEALGDGLRWETSRGGARFPHLYGALPTAAARSVVPIPRDPDGRCRLEGLLA